MMVHAMLQLAELLSYLCDSPGVALACWKGPVPQQHCLQLAVLSVLTGLLERHFFRDTAAGYVWASSSTCFMPCVRPLSGTAETAAVSTLLVSCRQYAVFEHAQHIKFTEACRQSRVLSLTI